MRDEAVDQLADLLAQADSSVSRFEIHAAADAVLTKEPAASRLLRALLDNPAIATSRSPEMPRALERIIAEISNANPRRLRAPLCPSCGIANPLLARDRNGPGRICTPCDRARRTSVTQCGSCQAQKIRHQHVVGIDYCRTCWKAQLRGAAGRVEETLRAYYPTLTATSVVEQLPPDRSRILRLALELEAHGELWCASPHAGSVQFAKLHERLRSAGADLPARVCGHCGTVTLSYSRLDGVLSCRRCYRNAHKAPCDVCHRTQALERRLADGSRLCQPCSRTRPEASGPCSSCKKARPIRLRTKDGPLCQQCRDAKNVDICRNCQNTTTCRFAFTTRAICEPCSQKKVPCRECGADGFVYSRASDGSAVCRRCAPRIIETCAACHEPRQVGGRVSAGPLCKNCYLKNPASWRSCVRCTRIDRLTANGRCTACHAGFLLDELLPPELTRDNDQLQRLHTACMRASPTVILGVFRREANVVLLRSLLNSPGTITHDQLDGLGTFGATAAVRGLLVEHGLLPFRNESVVRLEH